MRIWALVVAAVVLMPAVVRAEAGSCLGSRPLLEVVDRLPNLLDPPRVGFVRRGAFVVCANGHVTATYMYSPEPLGSGELFPFTAYVAEGVARGSAMRNLRDAVAGAPRPGTETNCTYAVPLLTPLQARIIWFAKDGLGTAINLNPGEAVPDCSAEVINLYSAANAVLSVVLADPKTHITRIE